MELYKDLKNSLRITIAVKLIRVLAEFVRLNYIKKRSKQMNIDKKEQRQNC